MRPSAAALCGACDDVRPLGDERRVLGVRRDSLDLDAHGVAQVASGDGADARRHRRREQHRLAGRRRRLEDGVDVLGEPHVEHLVGLVEHDQPDVVEAQRAPLDVVDRPARRGDDDVDAVAKGTELAADRLTAVDRQHAGVQLAAVAVRRLGHLHGELARRDEHEGDRPARRSVEELQRRQGERGGLAGTRGRLPEHVATGEQLGDGVGLDRRRLLVPECRQRASSSGRRPSSSNVVMAGRPTAW